MVPMVCFGMLGSMFSLMFNLKGPKSFGLLRLVMIYLSIIASIACFISIVIKKNYYSINTSVTIFSFKTCIKLYFYNQPGHAGSQCPPLLLPFSSLSPSPSLFLPIPVSDAFIICGVIIKKPLIGLELTQSIFEQCSQHGA